MLAALMRDLNVIELADVPVPPVEPGGVLVKVETCAICATDIKLLQYGHKAIRYPHVLGHEVAGTIAEVSPSVEGLQVGDRVALACVMPCSFCWLCTSGARTLCPDTKLIGYHYWGGFAQYLSVPRFGVEREIVKKIPEQLSFEEASIMEPLSTVLNAHEKIDTHLGDTVVVIGLGPMGCLHLTVARARGAHKVIAADILPGRLAMAERFGADVYVNSKEDDLAETVKRETGGRGASVVIAATPAKAVLTATAQLVAPRGRIMFFGGLPKDDPMIQFDANVVHYKEVTILGSFASAPEHCDRSLEALASGRIRGKDFITHSLPLKDLLAGMELMKRGERLKVIIRPWSE